MDPIYIFGFFSKKKFAKPFYIFITMFHQNKLFQKNKEFITIIKVVGIYEAIPTWQLTTVSNSSFRGSVALFWAPGAPGTHTYMQTKHHPHKDIFDWKMEEINQGHTVTNVRSWTDHRVKSICCSCRGSGFESQHQHSVSQLFITPVPMNPRGMHVVHTHTCRKHTQ